MHIRSMPIQEITWNLQNNWGFNTHFYFKGFFLFALISDLFFLECNLFSFEALDGFVFFRGFCFFIADFITSKKLWMTISRLECWLRESSLDIFKNPSRLILFSSFLWILPFSASESPLEFSTWKLSSTFVDVLLACCPPGPELLTALNSSSVSIWCWSIKLVDENPSAGLKRF